MTTGYIEYPFVGPADFNGWRSGHYSSRDWSGTDDKLHKSAENPYVCHTHVRTDPLLGPNSIGRYVCARTLATPDWNGSADPWDANATIKLYNKLGRRIREHEFNASIFLAEGKESLEMITSIARTMAKAIVYAKRGNFLEAARALNIGEMRRIDTRKQRAAQNWLAANFGLSPLVSDLRSAAIALAAITNRPVKIAVRAKDVRSGKLKNASSFIKHEYWHGKSIKYYLNEDYTVMDELGFTDPLPALWEITPYSFLVDYAIPIGSYLEARGLANKLTGKYVITDRIVRNVFGMNTEGTWTTGSRHLQYYWKWHFIQRTVGSGGLPGVPFPRLKPLNEVFSWQHCANSVALLVTHLRGLHFTGHTETE